MHLLSKTDLQKHIGQLKDIAYLLVNRGKPENFILPYFEEGQDWIEDYLEDYEMWKNREKLEKQYKKSYESGESDLVI